MTGAIPPTSWPATKRAICLEIPDSVDWVALVSGVIQQISFGYYWDKSYANWEDARDTGQEIFLSWLEQIRCDAGAIPIEEPQCVDYPNNSPMLDWQPANPFLSPGEIPPGYVAQPWGVVGNPPILTYQPGDVISGLFGLPVLTPALGQGLARVRIKFTGTGTVEVHLIKVALGGVALLTWDDNPLTATFVDTSMDFLALPPESSDEDIQEITFSTPGPHHIDVTMLPRFSAEVGFAGYGGGIRTVVLCGPDLQAVDQPPESGITDEFPGPNAPNGGTEVAICDVIRWNNGVLEVWCCNEWQPAPQIGTGAAPSPTQPPPSSPPSINECFTYNVSLNGKDKWILPFPVSEGYTVQIISPAGGWSDGTVNWSCPDGKQYALGACGVDVPAVGSDPLPTGANHMQIVGEITGSTGFFNPLTGTYIVPVGVSDEQLTFQANDDTLADNVGTIQFQVKVCATEVEEWCYEWDFTAQSGPVAPYVSSGVTYGTWSPGIGWSNIIGSGGGGEVTLIIGLDLSQADLVEFDLNVSGSIAPANHADVGPVFFTATHSQALVAGAQTVTDNTVGQSTTTFINAYNDTGSVDGLIITRLKVHGIGTPPGGPSTC